MWLCTVYIKFLDKCVGQLTYKGIFLKEKKTAENLCFAYYGSHLTSDDSSFQLAQLEPKLVTSLDSFTVKKKSLTEGSNQKLLVIISEITCEERKLNQHHHLESDTVKFYVKSVIFYNKKVYPFNVLLLIIYMTATCCHRKENKNEKEEMHLTVIGN